MADTFDSMSRLEFGRRCIRTWLDHADSADASPDDVEAARQYRAALASLDQAFDGLQEAIRQREAELDALGE